jgi:acyl-coenzyme A thioesterase PaaI-like protein
VPANKYEQHLASVRNREHYGCFVCDSGNALGIRAEYQAQDDGSVSATLDGMEIFQGYPRRLHGGVISTVLDGAMINCLFAHGVIAVTGELLIRFFAPAAVDRRMFVKAWLERSHAPLHLLSAELSQDERVLASASGKFMERVGASL